MKLKKVLLVVAMLMVGLMSGYNKDQNNNLSAEMNLAEKSANLNKPQVNPQYYHYSQTNIFNRGVNKTFGYL